MVIGKSESLAIELFSQDSILLHRVFDDVGSVAVDPAGEGRQEQVEWEEVFHDAAPATATADGPAALRGTRFVGRIERERKLRDPWSP